MANLPVPVNGTSAQVAAWLAAEGAAVLADDIRFSVVLSSLHVPSGRADVDDLWDGVAHISWVGGPAVGPLPQWPHDAGGRPLAHVATLHLGEVADVVEDRYRATWGPGMPQRDDPTRSLPDSGALEVFHDCETSGYEPQDAARAAWLVRWVPEPDGAVVDAAAPTAAPTDVCQVVIPSASFSVRSPEDSLELPDADFAAVEGVHGAILDAWQSWMRTRSVRYRVPLPHVYGHSWKGVAEVRDVLADVLPLTGDDEHILLLDLEGWTHLEGWFGDSGHLEVWMRRSDLAARAFDRAWCLVRMG